MVPVTVELPRPTEARQKAVAAIGVRVWALGGLSVSPQLPDLLGRRAVVPETVMFDLEFRLVA
jgi:hypothetical protein